MNWHSLIEDEQKNLSSARCSFWLTLIVSLILVILSAFDVVKLSAGSYTLLGTMFMFTAIWAAGPRIAQYLGPQIGKIAGALRSAKDDRRQPDIRQDDERGD